MHSWKRSWTGCWPRPESVPGARYSMHCTGQNSGHFPHGQQRFTSMNATSRGRFFFSPSSSGTSGTRSSFSRRLMTSIADMAVMVARARRRCNPSPARRSFEPSRPLALLGAVSAAILLLQTRAFRARACVVLPASTSQNGRVAVPEDVKRAPTLSAFVEYGRTRLVKLLVPARVHEIRHLEPVELETNLFDRVRDFE